MLPDPLSHPQLLARTLGLNIRWHEGGATREARVNAGTFANAEHNVLSPCCLGDPAIYGSSARQVLLEDCSFALHATVDATMVRWLQKTIYREIDCDSSEILFSSMRRGGAHGLS